MTHKTNPNKRVKKPRMVPFYFQHTQEMRELSEKIRAEENIEFASFCRSMFNIGIELRYGVKLVNNIPVNQEKT